MKIGFIGLGDMGLPMARRLVQAGLQPVLWNRSREKLASFRDAGAVMASSPREVMQRSQVVGLCLTSHEVVQPVCEGPDGLFAGRAPEFGRQLIVEFSTGSPAAAKELASKAASQGIGWVDAPVSGGVPAATEGRLTIFAGGDPQDVEESQALLGPLATRVSHMGPSGAGQMTKLCNQLIVSCNVMAIAEAIALGRKAGVVVAKLPAAMKGGFADSGPLQVFGPRMAEHVFEPRLGAAAMMHKDVRLASAIAAEVGASVPQLSLAEQLYSDACTSPDMDEGADLTQVIKLFETAL